MALMSLLCPEKVCLQVPSLRSHSLARESQAPEMKVFMSAERASDMQSPMWLVKMTFCLPVSRSHRQLERRGRKSVMSARREWKGSNTFGSNHYWAWLLWIRFPFLLLWIFIYKCRFWVSFPRVRFISDLWQQPNYEDREAVNKFDV